MLLVLACVAAAVWKLASNVNASGAATGRPDSAYAPYVDATLTPTYPFQSPKSNPVSSFYLGFIVSDKNALCTPSWGTFYTLAQADEQLNMSSRIAQVRAEGGNPAISFGGEANTELAAGCTSVSKLTAAYRTTIDTYKLNTVDFDVEGTTLANQAANLRRARAVARIQQQDPKLKVWMTLPVAKSGLTAEGLATVRAMLQAHVRLAGVNAMAMDFGPGQGASSDLLGTIEASLYATHAQVQTLWRQASLSSSSADAWQHMGVTVMIGVNDVESEHFTTSDAHGLSKFVNSQQIKRVSIWSLNRDSQCGGTFAATGELSNNCSGVRQSALEFTRILGQLPGTDIAQTSTAGSAPSPTGTSTAGSPGGVPYPVWSANAQYTAGYKVVWQGTIYQAQWWTQGTAPDSVTNGSANPWMVIGPVTSDAHYVPELLPQGHGSFPTWKPGGIYHAADRVKFNGLPYEARWYTVGTQPTAQLPADPSAPWKPLFTAPGEPAASSTGS